MSQPSEYGDRNQFGSVAFYAAIGKAFLTMCAIIPVLAAIELIDVVTGHYLDDIAGVRPRELDGLDGVLFAPFLHASFEHLLSNSVPLLLTGTFILASGVRRFVLVTGVVAVISGLGAWLTGPSHTIGIGASGVVFGYIAFLLAQGLVERRWWSAAVALLIAFLYGWSLTGVLPTDPGVGWQAHAFGVVGGVLAAVVFRRRRPRPVPSGEPSIGTISPIAD